MKYQIKHRPEPIGTDNFWLRRDGQPLQASRIEKLVSIYGKKAGLKRCYAQTSNKKPGHGNSQDERGSYCSSACSRYSHLPQLSLTESS